MPRRSAALFRLGTSHVEGRSVVRRGPVTESPSDEGLYLAGHLAPPGRYRRVDPPDGRIVVLERADVLPASLDGRVAVYAPVPIARPLWPSGSPVEPPRTTRAPATA